MPYLFPTTQSLEDKIKMGLENFEIALELKKVTEYKALYSVGQGLVEALRRTTQRNYTLCKAADDYDVPRNKARNAFRIYNVFQYWPQALDFMIDLPIVRWSQLSDHEVNQLQQVLLNQHTEPRIPREWTLAYGETVTGYHVNIDDNGEQHRIPMYAEQVRPEQVDVRELTGYSTGTTSSDISRSTDMGWWD
jgi:hypothetical protein